MNDRPHEMGQDHPTPACATGRLRATSLCFARSPSTWSPETGAPKPASVAGARRLPGTTATCSRSSHAKLMREPWINTAHDLQQQGVKVLLLTENVDTETPTGRLMFNFLGTIAEYFLDLNRERTIEGLKAALARGRKGGRRRKLSEADQAVARAMLKDSTIPVAAIAKRLGVSRATFYAYFPGARRRALPSQEARP